MSHPIESIITAAGDSQSLFIGAGFESPKNLVEVDSSLVLARAIQSYTCTGGHTTVAIGREEDMEWSTAKRIQDKIPEANFLRVSSRVQGALVTAVLATAGIAADAPLVIAAGDSEVVGGIDELIQFFVDSDSEAGTIVFPSSNPRWSYISLDHQGLVNQVAEKTVIGPFATTGVFYFKSCEIFLKSATWCFLNNATSNGKYYVSTALNLLISEGMRVDHREISRDRYRSWSLPIDFVRQPS